MGIPVRAVVASCVLATAACGAQSKIENTARTVAAGAQTSAFCSVARRVGPDVFTISNITAAAHRAVLLATLDALDEVAPAAISSDVHLVRRYAHSTLDPGAQPSGRPPCRRRLRRPRARQGLPRLGLRRLLSRTLTSPPS